MKKEEEVKLDDIAKKYGIERLTLKEIKIAENWKIVKREDDKALRRRVLKNIEEMVKLWYTKPKERRW